MTASRRAMPNRTCAATLQPMDSQPVTGTPPLRCPTCGYDLHAADLAAPCPECGTPGADALKPSLVNHATDWSLKLNLAGAAVLMVPAAIMIVELVAGLCFHADLLRGLNPRLYDTLQVMVLVIGSFFLTDTGRSPRLAALRRRGWLVRGAAGACGILTAYLLYSARETILYGGGWSGPSPRSWRGLFFDCLLPAVIAFGLIALWRYLWLWAEAARERRARVLIVATFGVALAAPAQLLVHALASFAHARAGDGSAFLTNFTRLSEWPRLILFVASVALWLVLAARIARTTATILHKRRSQ